MSKFLLLIHFLLTMFVGAYSQTSFVEYAAEFACAGIQSVAGLSAQTASNPSVFAEDQLFVQSNVRNHYMIAELNSYSVSLHYPLRNTYVAARFCNRGLDSFNESFLSLSTGLRIFERLYAGISVGLIRQSFREMYPNSYQASYKFGLFHEVSNNLQLGFILENPYISDRLAFVRQSLCFGVSYKIIPELILLSEVEYLRDKEVELKGAFEYQLSKRFQVFLGTSTHLGKVSFGCRVQISDFQLLLASSRLPYLGFSHQMALVYAIRK